MQNYILYLTILTPSPPPVGSLAGFKPLDLERRPLPLGLTVSGSSSGLLPVCGLGTGEGREMHTLLVDFTAIC